MIPIINKSTRVRKNSATAINQIMANCILYSQLKTAIIKSDVLDPFLITMASKTDKPIDESQQVQNVHKWNYYGKAIKSFK